LKKVLSVLAAAVLLAGCSSSSDGGSGDALKIAHIPKLGTIGYFQAADKGVQRACAELVQSVPTRAQLKSLLPHR
jgi:ABC-type sugar transport system substrate-binding protein